MVEPPYRRIVAEITAQIRSGHLGPGDTVPSTRAIVRDWGVAMATATRVIATLKADGLVDAMPGRGTVVRAAARHQRRDPRPDRKDAKARTVGRDDVVDEAIQIADTDGIDLLTMRRLAGNLNVPTMSLYQHAASKAELISVMTDQVFAHITLPNIPVLRCRPRLEAGARIFRELFTAHPWAAAAFSLTRPQLIPNVVPLVEWNLRTLDAMGLAVEEMMFAHISIFNLVVSMSRTAASERQAEADSGQSMDDWAATHLAATEPPISPTATPTLLHVTRTGFDYDLDALFEYGLRTLLDGIETRHPKTLPTKPQTAPLIG